MNDFPEPTDPAAPSQEQQSNQSLQKSTNSGEPSSLEQLVPKRGDHNVIVKGIANELISESETISGKELDQAGRDEIIKFVSNISRGPFTYMPMICKGAECYFYNVCPLQKANSELPVGKACPVEHAAMKSWISKHIEALGIEDPNSPEHSFDMDMLFELAGQELIRWRCSVHLSEKPELIEEKQVGSSVTGDPIYAEVINPVLDVMEKAGYNVRKLRESLLATRAAKLKLTQTTNDSSNSQSEVKKRVEDILRKKKLSTNKTEDEEESI